MANQATLRDGPARPTLIRHFVVFVTMLMAILLYLDRLCVSFAADYIREDLSLTQADMGWFLSAFFWSYALAQVPSGWFSDRFGARAMLVLYILSWSLFTALIGAATSLVLLVGMRLGCGLGQAGAYPTSASVIAKWVPFANRGFASSVVAFGGRVGGAVSPILTAWLMVLFVPLSVPSQLSDQDLLNAPSLCAKLAPAGPSPGTKADEQSGSEPTPPGRRVWSLLSPSIHPVVARVAGEYRASSQPESTIRVEDRSLLIAGLNGVLDDPDLYRDDDFRNVNLSREALAILRRLKSGDAVSSPEVRRFNRLLLEAAFPSEIGKLYVHGWRPVMVVYGAAGLLVAALFWIAFRSRPEEHPWCNRAECDLIAEGRPPGAPSPHGKPRMVPMERLLASPSMWFNCLSQLGTNVGWLFLITWLPRYLVEVHEVPILRRGLMATLPLAAGILGMLFGGKLTDLLVPLIGLRWGRRLPILVTRFTGALGYGLCIGFALTPAGSWLNSPWMFTGAFALVAISVDMGNPASWAFHQDVGGRYVGSILGWGNMWGNLGAAVAPPIYNLVLGETPGVSEWNLMFAVCVGALVASGLCALGIDATIPIAPPDDEHEA